MLLIILRTMAHTFAKMSGNKRRACMTHLFNESVLCHRTLKRMTHRPRASCLFLCLDLVRNKQLCWPKRLGPKRSQEGLPHQTLLGFIWVWAGPLIEWEAYSLLSNKVRQRISLWPALTQRGRESHRSAFRFYGLLEGPVWECIWLVSQRRNYGFVAWLVREWGVETGVKDEVRETLVLRPCDVL